MLKSKYPCSCGGMNENCYRCGGWGYVDSTVQGRDAFPADVPSDGGQWSHKSKIRVSNARKTLQVCPHCRQKVGKLIRHLRVAHGVTITRPMPATSAHRRATAAPVPRAIAKPAPMSVVRTPAPRPAPVGASTPVNLSTKMKLVRCNYCSCLVRADYFDRHLARTHRNLPKRSMGSTSVSVGENPKTEPVAGVWQRDNAERVFDASKDYYAACRDHGQFGSHPAHDGFDDESGA